MEQIESEKRAKEKYEKRVWGNWRKLIKAALIRERLTAKYDFNKEEEKKPSASDKQTNKRGKQTAAATAAAAGGKKTKTGKKK